MKKLFLIAGIALLPAFAFAQTTSPKPWEGNPFVTDTTKNIATEQYCIITPEQFGRQIKLSADFGDMVNREGSPYYILDNNHKQMKFNNIAHGLNYMATQGWLFVNTILHRDGYPSYVLRKVVTAKAAQ